MASIPNKVQYFKRGESSWELFYFETSADQIAATDTLQVSTKAQLNLINNYLNDFNTAEHLVKLDENVKIPVGLLPDISATYLTKNNPTYTGTLQGIEAKLTTIKAYDNKDASITLGGQGEDIVLSGEGLLKVNNSGIELNGGSLNMKNGKITNLGLPTQTTDAANKEYVDNKVSSGFTTKAPVKAASISNIDDITAVLNSLDSVPLNANDRVLLKNQETASENGVYQLDSDKKLNKVDDDSAVGSAVFVEYGETNNDYIYHCSTENTWVAFSKPDTIKDGAGLTKSGTTLSIANEGVTSAMLAGDIFDGKIKPFVFYDNIIGWSGMPQSTNTPVSISDGFNTLFTAIKLLRGETSYKEDNLKTISGAYSSAATAQTAANNAMAAIPTIGVGKNLPTSGMKSGDLFFLEK